MSICLSCGIPLDAGIFDSSAILSIQTSGEAGRLGSDTVSLGPGETAELARFELQPEICGVLVAFSQFTDLYASDSRNVITPGYQWALLSDGRPLAPWLKFDRIINPWGLNGFPLAVRLDQGVALSLVVENINVKESDPQWLRQVGGRIVGRFWLDDEHAGKRPLQTYEPWR